MARLSISMLGTLQIRLEDQPVTGFESVKARALLAYLADEPGQLRSRSTLAGLLWPERPEITALNNLRHVLSSLRRTIRDADARPPVLLADREFISLNPFGDYSVDTRDFCKLENASRDPKASLTTHLANMVQAVSLYQGEFLDAFPCGNSPDFEEWILTRREMYRSQFLELLNVLAKVYILQGEFGLAKDYAHRQLEIEPWREEAHCQLMEALALDGKRSEALAQYSVCCAVLQKELNVEPSQTSIHLFELIRDGNLNTPGISGIIKPAPLIQPQYFPFGQQVRRLHNLPRSMTSFIGRTQEINQLKQLITDHCFVVLTGPGGIGKSRLALEVAYQLMNEFRDGVWQIDLAPLDHPDQIITATFNALGLGNETALLTMDRLIEHLQNQQILLLFDNCEHLLKDFTLIVQALLQACPELKILSTSRFKPGVEGEEIFCPPSLACPDPIHSPLPEAILDSAAYAAYVAYAAVHLFIERARAILPSFQVTERDLCQIINICKRLDGNPLAIETAVSHLSLLTIDQLASRLNDSYHLLDFSDHLDLPKRRILQETIEWGFQMLSQKEGLLLQRLSVFEGGWTLGAAEGVCAGEGIHKWEILDLLTGLVNKSMVIFDGPPEADAHFRLMNTVHQFAQEKLRQMGEEIWLYAAYCTYFKQLAQVAKPRLSTWEQIAWLYKLDADRDNLFQVMRWAIDEGHDFQTGLQILVDLERWWTLRGYFAQGVNWLRKGLTVWQDRDSRVIPLRVAALCLLAKLETNRLVAISWVKQALSLAYEIWSDSFQELGIAIYTAGYLSRVWDWNASADLTYIDQSIRIFTAHIPSRSWEIGYLLDEKSMAYLLLGDMKNAGSLARESWEIFQESGDHWFSYPLTVLALIAMQQGHYNQARAYMEDAITQKAGVDDAWGLGLLGLMGSMERVQGHYGEAVAELREAIRRSRHHLFYFDFINLIQDLAFTEIECSREWNADEAERHLLHATRLLGAAEAGLSVDALRIFSFPKQNYDPMVTELRARLDANRLGQLWNEGRAMSVDKAAAYALEYPLAG